METKASEELYELFKSQGFIKSPKSLGKVWNLLEGYLDGKTVDYDMEAIEGDRDYSRLFRMHAKTFSDEYQVSRSDCKSFYDHEKQRAGIKVTIGENQLEAEWNQTSDWVEPAFYDFITQKVEPLLQGKFVKFVDLDQGYSGIYLPNDVADDMNVKLRKFEQDIESGKFE